MRRLLVALTVGGLMALGGTGVAEAAPQMVTKKVGKYTIHFPAKPTTAAKLKAKAAQCCGGNVGAPVPPGSYFHMAQACGVMATAVGTAWGNQPTNFLSIYGVPYAAQYPGSYQMYRDGGVAFFGDWDRLTNTIVRCHDYVGDRANSVRDPGGTSISYQDGCDVQITLGGWDDGGWNITLTGWYVTVYGCVHPSV